MTGSIWKAVSRGKNVLVVFKELWTCQWYSTICDLRECMSVQFGMVKWFHITVYSKGDVEKNLKLDYTWSQIDYGHTHKLLGLYWFILLTALDQANTGSLLSILSVHPFIHLSIHPSAYLSVCPSICTFIVHPSICLSIHPSVHSSICLFIHLSTHPSLPPSVNLLVYLSITIKPNCLLKQGPLVFLITLLWKGKH